MPIEIRELVIRASIADAAASDARLDTALARLKQELMQQCLEKIREQLERGNER
jgi:hypothetical protein